MRRPDEVDKTHPGIEHLDLALQLAAEVYPVAEDILGAWDGLPVSVRAAIVMEADDLARADAWRRLLLDEKHATPATLCDALEFAADANRHLLTTLWKRLRPRRRRAAP